VSVSLLYGSVVYRGGRRAEAIACQPFCHLRDRVGCSAPSAQGTLADMAKGDKNKTIAIVAFSGVALLDLVATKKCLTG
jgi:hypothetical protein